MGAVTQTYGSWTSMTLTNLASQASSATAGWITEIIDNRPGTGAAALDYEFQFTFPMANTSPANDKTIYVMVVPAMHDGSAWVLADGGTATLPTAGPADYTFAGITTTNNFRPMVSLAYTTADQVVQGVAKVSDAVGQLMPDGFALFVLNYTGAAFDGSGQVIAYRTLGITVA